MGEPEMKFTQEAMQAAENFQNQIIPHSRFQSVLESIENAVEIASTGIFTGVRVSAPSGSGKTALISHVKNRLDMQYGGDGSIAMITASLKENPSVSQVQNELTDHFKLATRGPRSANNNDVNLIMVNAIITHRVRLIAIDEFQHVFLASGLKVATPVIDWLKRLMNYVQVPVVLLGTEAMDRLVGVDAQLTSRIPTVGRMGYFKLNSEWFGFIKALAGSCKEMDLTKIYEDKSMAAAMHMATGGSPRMTKALLIHAICIGISSGTRTLTTELLREAHAKQMGADADLENFFV
jgi:hypothetical protein